MISDIIHIPSFSLPAHAKVFIFQAARTLAADKETEVDAKIKDFLLTWTSHGNYMQTEYHLILHRFIVLAIDDKPVFLSGCAQDELNRFIMSLQKFLNISLFDRMIVSYWKDDVKEVDSIHITKIPEAIINRKWKDDTLIFDNTISTLDDFRKKWILPWKETWISRFSSLHQTS